jgi:hypothetical protein
MSSSPTAIAATMLAMQSDRNAGRACVANTIDAGGRAVPAAAGGSGVVTVEPR